MKWFYWETKIATISTVLNRMPSAPPTIQNVLSSACWVATVENKPYLAFNLYDRFRAPLLSGKIDSPNKRDAEQKHAENKYNGWEKMNSEDADEGCWEMVDPFICGNEVWFSGFPQKRPSPTRMQTDKGSQMLE